MNYTYSTLQDFLQDDSFVRWVLFEEDDLFWEQFSDTNPEKLALLLQARDLILRIRESQDWSVPDINKTRLWERIQKNIELPVHLGTVPSRESRNISRSKWRRLSLFGIGFIVIIIFGVVWTGTSTKTYQTYNDLVVNSENPDKRIERYNTNAEPLLITLEDGSTILLRKNGRINYPDHFKSNKREVILSGEAFFKISRNPAKPFYVYTNGCVTKVLGTSFDIKTDDDKNQVIVNVRTGRVSVFSGSVSLDADPEKAGVVLLPNQKVVFDQKAESLTRKLVEEPHRINELAGRENVHFDEASVTDILKSIEKLYGLKLLYSEEQLSKCIITTTLTDDPLYEQLDIICKTIGASYKEVDAQIIIESPGCN